MQSFRRSLCPYRLVERADPADLHDEIDPVSSQLTHFLSLADNPLIPQPIEFKENFFFYCCRYQQKYKKADAQH
jgi:hypothetical protein